MIIWYISLTCILITAAVKKSTVLQTHAVQGFADVAKQMAMLHTTEIVWLQGKLHPPQWKCKATSDLANGTIPEYPTPFFIESGAPVVLNRLVAISFARLDSDIVDYLYLKSHSRVARHGRVVWPPLLAPSRRVTVSGSLPVRSQAYIFF